MAVSPIRAFAEQSAARTRAGANKIRSIADYTQTGLDDIGARSGMIPGSMTPDMMTNIPYQSRLMAEGLDSRAGQAQGMAAEMPRLINAYRAYKAEQDAKSKAGQGGGYTVDPSTPEIPVYGDYLDYANVPSISRIGQEFDRPYQYTAPYLPKNELPITKKPMSTISAAYKRMLEARAKK